MGKASRNKSPQFRVAPSSGLLPMSAALIELVEPLRHDELPLKGYQLLITLGAFAWNLSLFPSAERKTKMQAYFKIEKDYSLSFNEILALASDEEITEEPNESMNLIQALKALIHRKERLFPEDRRFVENATVDWKHENFHVQAASMLPKSAEAASEV